MILPRSRRLWIALAGVAVATGCLLHSREPVFQGKRLSVWRDDLHREWKEEDSAAEAAARQKWTNVVCSVGTNGLPCFLDWIRDDAHLSHQSASIEAFEILGPTAAPAIPSLTRLLTNEPADRLARVAAYCLEAIGPAAVPALSNAVLMTTNRGRIAAIATLGNLGPKASAVAPLLIQVTRESSVAALVALAALVEIETNVDMLEPLLVEHLRETNSAGIPQFGLARLGKRGTLILLESLTNDTRNVRCFAEAALSPGFQTRLSTWNQAVPPRLRGNLKAVFNLEVIRAGAQSYNQGDYQVAAQTVQRYVDDPDPVIRTAASNVWNFLQPILRTNPVPQAVRDGASGTSD